MQFIHEVEKLVAHRVGSRTIRCRVRANAIAIEIDSEALAELEEIDKRILRLLISAIPHRPADLPIYFEGYRKSHAFVGSPSA